MSADELRHTAVSMDAVGHQILADLRDLWPKWNADMEERLGKSGSAVGYVMVAALASIGAGIMLQNNLKGGKEMFLALCEENWDLNVKLFSGMHN